ncbi:MAG: protein kinase [Sandaracinaceae bacterium]
MKVCTICGAKWRGEPSVCPLDGGPLEDLPDPLLARTIAGRYVITERIGAGGMGTVYRARHEVVGRDVAIKFLSPDLAADATNRNRFLREAKAANRIDHEHIIDITDFGETEDGLVYLVMEFLHGQPLSDLIAQGPIMPFRAVDIARQMASALARAHELDVIHRDIKPDNVFLIERHGGGDFIKILDFGLAKMKGEIRLTASGAVFGTPEYMAPEQARGAPLTGKADLYALGCVLYEMLTGDPPFDGPTPDLILKHIREVPVPPSQRVASIPASVDEIVMQLLEKDPERRHVDAYHLFEDLRKVGSNLPRPSAMPTMREANYELALAAKVPRPGPIPSTISNSADAWDTKIERFKTLAARAYEDETPTWLSEALMDLERDVGALARRRAELDRCASAVMQQEEEIRNARLRVGTAIDVLGRDESRSTRQLDDLHARLARSQAKLQDLEPRLRAAWQDVPPMPGARAPLDAVHVSRLTEVGRVAADWLTLERELRQITAESGRITREREDLRFQVSQLKGRMATLTAEGDVDLDSLRDRTRRADVEVQTLLDAIARRSETIVKHLLEFPQLREAVQATR